MIYNRCILFGTGKLLVMKEEDIKMASVTRSFVYNMNTANTANTASCYSYAISSLGGNLGSSVISVISIIGSIILIALNLLPPFRLCTPY